MKNVFTIFALFIMSLTSAKSFSFEKSLPYKKNPSHLNFDWSQIPMPKGLQGINTKQIAGFFGDSNTNSADANSMQVIVFISFSMPEHSIEKLFADALPIIEQVTFVLRGTDESSSITKTAQRIHKLKDGFDIHIDIDPEQFERFGITQVPAFIVHRSDSVLLQQCLSSGLDPASLKDEFIGVYGDVSIQYAFNYLLLNESHSGFSTEIEALVNSLNGTSGW